MPLHKDLTGADLHELKGADSAAANSIPVADGLGTTTFKLLGPENFNPLAIPQINRQMVPFSLSGDGDSFDLYVGQRMKLTEISYFLRGELTLARTAFHTGTPYTTITTFNGGTGGAYADNVNLTGYAGTELFGQRFRLSLGFGISNPAAIGMLFFEWRNN